MLLLNSSAVLTYCHGWLCRKILLYLCSHFLFFIIIFRQFINKLVWVPFLIAAVQHIHISIVSIFNGHIVGFVSWIIRVVFKYILSWLSFESKLSVKYIPRLLIMCCIIFLEYLLIYAFFPWDNNLSSCFCCSSSTWSNYFI